MPASTQSGAITGAGRQAALAHVTILQAPQRRRRVGVVGGDREVLVLGGRLAVEGDVPGASADAGRLVQQRRLGGHGRIERADQLRVAHPVRPSHPERLDLQPEPPQRALVRGRLGAEDADTGGEHQPGGLHPGQQRDLGVVVLNLARHPVAHGPAIALALDLLLGHGEADSASRLLQRHPPGAHLPQQLRELGGDVVVGVLRDAANLGSDDGCRGRLAADVEVDRPEDGGTPLPWEEAGGPLR